MIGVGLDFKTAAQQGRLDFLNTGAGLAEVRIYGTARPGAGGAAGGAALVTIQMTDPAGSIDGSGNLDLDFDPDGALVANTGDAVWARFFNADGDFAFDCDVKITADQALAMGVPERAGEVELSGVTVTMYAGALVTVTSCVLGG